MSRTRTVGLLAGALGAVLALGACASPQGGAPVDDGRSSGSPTHASASCPQDAQKLMGTTDYLTLPLLPASVTPTGVVRCSVQTVDDVTTGRWNVYVQEKATGGIDAFVSALRLPSEPTPAGDYACTADLRLLPWLAVVLEDGSWMRVGTPVTYCGKPLPAVDAALQAITWTTVSSTRGERVLTPEQLAAQDKAASLGCSNEFKDMVAIEASSGATDRATPSALTGTGPWALCRYTVDPTSTDPVATFVDGVTLTAAQVTQVQEQLARATAPAPGCPAGHTTLVGLFSPQGGWVLLETDGCGRVTTENSSYGVLPADAVSAIASLAP